jgi:hypothetical protein
MYHVFKLPHIHVQHDKCVSLFTSAHVQIITENGSYKPLSGKMWISLKVLGYSPVADNWVL